MEKLLEIGLSGWIIFLVTIIFGGGITVRQIFKRRTRQFNIKAGGDVAGGDILKSNGKVRNCNVSSKKIINNVQKNIEAKGDVAGGDIIKGDK